MLLLTFRAAANLYAVDVTRVVEVVPRVDLRRLPHAPRYLAGLFDYRGKVVPVVDLGVLLGADACHDRLSTRIVLVDLRSGSSEGAADHVDDASPQASGADLEHSGSRERHHETTGAHRWLVGLIAEHVSDVASASPEQVISPPMSLPDAPYLGAIVQIGQEMTQLIVADHLLEPSFRHAFFEGAHDDRGANASRPGLEVRAR